MDRIDEMRQFSGKPVLNGTIDRMMIDVDSLNNTITTISTTVHYVLKPVVFENVWHCCLETQTRNRQKSE